MDYNPFRIEGKAILITGASSGIGRVTAIECSRMGSKMIITGRNKERLNETFQMLQGDGHIQFVSDLTMSEKIDELTAFLPPLDGIVFCAGISKRVPLKFIKEDKFIDLFKINFFAPSQISLRLYAQNKLNKEASLVFISSVAASYATVGSVMYMSSKGALNSFVKGIANEMALSSVRANAIQPGMIKTNMANAISDEDINNDLKKYPLGRYGYPEEIAFAAIYLLSNTTKWMTGSILTIDGGLTLR